MRAPGAPPTPAGGAPGAPGAPGGRGDHTGGRVAADGGRGDVGRAEKSATLRRRPSAGPARGATPAPRSVSGVAAIRGSGSHSKRIGTGQWSPYVNADGESVDVYATREFFDRSTNSLACTSLTMRTVADTNSLKNYTCRGRRDCADETHAHRLFHRAYHASPRLMTRPCHHRAVAPPGARRLYGGAADVSSSPLVRPASARWSGHRGHVAHLACSVGRIETSRVVTSGDAARCPPSRSPELSPCPYPRTPRMPLQ